MSVVGGGLGSSYEGGSQKKWNDCTEHNSESGATALEGCHEG